MTCCVLTGFKKAKKHVGTIYACDGSDLPATQDFGTIQFSGPYETVQTVPATEVTYMIIGKTQCGDDIRRITTKTYSSRAFPNGYKYPDGSMHPNVGGFPIVGTSGPVIGATIDDVRNAILAVLYSQLAASYSVDVFVFNNKRMSTYVDAPPNRHYAQYDYYNNGVLQSGENGYLGTASGAVSRPTLYYLDVNEVWTYDLV